MEMKIKFKSVAWKWILNVFLVIFCIILALEVIFTLFIHSYYTTEIEAKAKEYAQSFISTLKSAPTDNFEALAKDYCEKFEHKEKMEIQVIGANGTVLVSTSGFAYTPETMPDYEQAKTGEEGSYVGKSTVGEDVLAETTMLFGEAGEGIGAVRWIVSLEQANKQVFIACIIAVIIGAAVLGM